MIKLGGQKRSKRDKNGNGRERKKKYKIDCTEKKRDGDFEICFVPREEYGM